MTLYNAGNAAGSWSCKASSCFIKACRWLADSAYNHVSGGRLRNEGVREKYQARFEQLQKKPYYPFLIRFLAAYVTKTIPNYVASEYTYWSISCLPKYLLSSKCVTRININEVPVLSIFEGEAGNLQVALYASQLPFLSALTEKSELQTIFSGLPTVYFEHLNRETEEQKFPIRGL